MLFSSKKIIGLDIGSSSIKIAEMTVNKNGAVLDNFALIQSPSQAMNNGEITDSLLISEAIKTAFKENGFRNKKACVGLSGTAVIVKKISIPKVEAKDIREQVQYEAAQYLPFDINQVTLDYHQLSFSQNAGNADILVVAAQNEFILSYLETVSRAGLKGQILDVGSLALANVFELNYGRPTSPSRFSTSDLILQTSWFFFMAR